MKRIMYPDGFTIMLAAINFAMAMLYRYGIFLERSDASAEFWLLATIVMILVSVVYGKKEK